MVGRRFGKLVVVELFDTVRYGKRKKPFKRWRCRCDCGAERNVLQPHLTRGRQVSCGCSKLADRSAPPPTAVLGARWIPLGNGKFTLVDEADFEKLSRHPWSLDSVGYAGRRVDNRLVRLHRFLLPGVPLVDHRNRNRLDNRRDNLRAVTLQQSVMNTGLQKDNRSGYRGVSFYPPTKKWRARLARKFLGYFTTPEDAAHAWDEAALRAFGAFVRLNFPKRRER